MTATFVPDDDFVRIADICTTLGVPDDDRVLFWRWADELPSAKAVDELNSYVDVLIAERCRRPADDELSELIALGLTATRFAAGSRSSSRRLAVAPSSTLRRAALVLPLRDVGLGDRGGAEPLSRCRP
ncbi:cytochrome P450 [Mycolicibacterium pallens]|uniref:Cytochrome P450 n=1 Tax=Mycolicibacterium pallens TaxID=370524 RepID=A0ABX8VSX4_9MYCO|nr:cytochrome P450 [Mycolicibacterium pallens]QYL19216.1 cytochrome P450 [Mycolicibacterium pallens]